MIADNISLSALAIGFAWFGARALARNRAAAAAPALTTPLPTAQPASPTEQAVEAGPAAPTKPPSAAVPTTSQVSVGG
jgi:hypothetical protein